LNDPVMLLEDMPCPPGKGRFFKNLVGDSIFCHLDRVSFLEVLKRDPRRSAILPGDKQLPSLGSSPWALDSISCGFITIVLGYG
jgi:hypothetical protein